MYVSEQKFGDTGTLFIGLEMEIRTAIWYGRQRQEKICYGGSVLPSDFCRKLTSVCIFFCACECMLQHKCDQ